MGPGGVWAWYRGLGPGWRILVWLCFGIFVGFLLGEDAVVFQPIGDIFLRLLLMAAVPLVFFNLLSAITGSRDAKGIAVLGVKVVAYYSVTTILALAIGLIGAHLIQPGIGFELSAEAPEVLVAPPSLVDVLVNLVPTNVFEAFATGQLAQLIVFAALLGAACLLLPDRERSVVADFFAHAAALLRKLVEVVLWAAPYGLGALAASTMGRYGSELISSLGLFLVTIWIGQVVMVLVYMLILRLFARTSPSWFLKQTAQVYATTAATCSSLASLVVSPRVAKDNLALPEKVYSFTLPLGAQINKDGTAIMLSVILLFTAQAAGIRFTLTEQITILITGLLISEGSGGIPGGGLVVALVFVQAFNLPTEIAAVVAGVYRLIDMGSTTVNCMGDLVCASVFGRRHTPPP